MMYRNNIGNKTIKKEADPLSKIDFSLKMISLELPL